MSKCFVETLGRYMSEQEEVSTIAVRMGGFQSSSFLRDALHNICALIG